ncbi:MAG: hypothetical protein ACOC8A_01755 [bacterium]
MPRLARGVMPGVPHHVTERGHHRQRTFFGDDYEAHLALLAEWCPRRGVELWAMPAYGPKGPWKHKKGKGRS